MKFFNGYKLYLGFLLVIFLGVFLTNFPFGSYMTGWDNLHPEFNFALNFKRGIESVWQFNQGVGTFGGHGYAATLPHTFVLFLMSLILPDMYLRSTFTFLMLLLGSTGVFFFMRNILKKEKESVKNISSLAAAVFYMLNFATVQNFYIQLEAFIIHFAALPWLFYSIINYLEKNSLKNFSIFLTISLFASAQGFIPPLFFVYILVLSVFLSIYTLTKKTFSAFKNAVLIFAVTLLANLYWLLPVIFYSLFRSEVYLSAYINLSSTENFILKNQLYGNMGNLSILRGFISKAIDSNGQETFFIFAPWIEHLNLKAIKVVGYLLFGISLLGLVTAILKKRMTYRWFILAGFIITFALLATDTFPFNYLTQLMQQIPVLKQAFRVAFTKFSISVSLFYAITFGLGVFGIISFINRINKNSLRQYLIGFVTMLILSGILFFSFPIFKGNFIYERTRIDIPQSYFQLFDFFKEQKPSERIANLPQGWNWGWSVYDWPASPESSLGGGYSGSGFLWYGIEQPIMDRSFDVWGSANESYYWELTHAIYSEKYDLLDKIFNKYRVKWVVFDKNIIPYTNAKGFIFRDELEKYLDTSSNYTLVKTLKSDNAKDIKIYEVKTYDNFSLNNLKSINPDYKYTMLDQATTDYGNYYTDNKTVVYYPFRNLFSNKTIDKDYLGKNDITIEETEASLTLKAKIPDEYINALISSKEISEEDKASLLSITKEGNIVSVRTSKHSGNSYDSRLDSFFTNHKANNCEWSKEADGNFSQKIVEENILRFRSINSENCYSIALDNLPQRYGYLIDIKSRNITGRSLQFALINEDSKKAEIEYGLTKNTEFTNNYLFMPSMKRYGIGYSIIFNNISIGKNESINDLKQVNVYPIPYELISSIKLSLEDNLNTNIITNDAAYDDAWAAYIVPEENFINKALPFINGQKIEKHVKLNGWANGWDVDSSKFKVQNSKLVIVFMPQYLEYLGLILAGIPIAILLALFTKYFMPQTLNRINKLNSFFEKKAEFFKLKIAETHRNSNVKENNEFSI